ncbi:hypothetical protein DRZ78_01700 [Candidatus Aerophobetes bacterium]|uniref:Uncharacterized protein n=1 Tax=Aerophobetes bacterium TaxID=2030807 RepID=A0A662D5T4_UNCAE|nr:MAG: hypothetical protein DRZ78_01700 [Candidatus Aerophobetes bacterium]
MRETVKKLIDQARKEFPKADTILIVAVGEKDNYRAGCGWDEEVGYREWKDFLLFCRDTKDRVIGVIPLDYLFCRLALLRIRALANKIKQ